MASRGSYDTSRRIFRGRGGPTDRRLPKHQARKRNANKDASAKANKYNDDIAVRKVSPPQSDQDENDFDEEDRVRTEVGLGANDSVHCVESSAGEELLYTKEIQHLLKRIRNVSESISLSATAISNPQTWRKNVLNAVRNTVAEWRSIVLHYPEITSAKGKEGGLHIYMLVQQAMQSGPLAGSNPGYFKRCGAVVAAQALMFLESCVEDDTDAQRLFFSEKQAQAIQKWKQNAAKATEKNKPPSKSQVKKQQGKHKKK